jgi:hypothetical protein
MKALTSKKAIIAILSVSSIVIAGTIRDMKTHSKKLTVAQVEADSMLAERSVASLEVSKVAQMNLPMNAENIKKINAGWEIARIVDADKTVAFDKFQNPEDAKKSIKIKMELVGNGIVRLNNDNQQVYRVSILSDFGTIAIFKKIGNGFEILEAKKIQEVAQAPKALVVSEEVDLVLERALNQTKSNKVLVGDKVSGRLTLANKVLNSLSIELTNDNGEKQSIEIDSADLMDGGTFKTEVNGEEVSGVIFNNGKDGYRMSFVTGPLAGAMLNFVTKEQFDKIQEQEEEANRNAVQKDFAEDNTQQEIQATQAPALEERKEVASNVENQEPVEILSADEVKQTAQENGFAF